MTPAFGICLSHRQINHSKSPKKLVVAVERAVVKDANVLFDMKLETEIPHPCSEVKGFLENSHVGTLRAMFDAVFGETYGALEVRDHANVLPSVFVMFSVFRSGIEERSVA